MYACLFYRFCLFVRVSFGSAGLIRTALTAIAWGYVEPHGLCLDHCIFFLVCVGLRNTTTNHNLMTENQFFVGAPLSFKACSGHIVYRIWDYFWHTITGGPQSNHPEPVGTDPSFSGVYFSSALLSTHSWCHCASDSNVAGSATFVAACFVGVSAVHRIFAPRVNHPGIPNLVNCSTFSFLFADLWHIHLWYQDLGTKP